MEKKSFESELSYQRYVCKGDMRRGRDRMLEVLPRIINRASELLENQKQYGKGDVPMNNNDLFKWFESYTEELRQANQEWYEASQRMKLLDSLEAAAKKKEV